MKPISHDPDRGFDGRWLVAATLSLFVIVPLFVWTLFALVRPGGVAPTPEPLVYAARETWPAFAVTPESLEREMMSRARTNERYVDLPFDPSVEQERAIAEAVAMAERPDFLAAEGLEPRLAALARDAGFYADALLALRAQHRGDAAEAEAAWARAFLAAPAAAHQRVLRGDGSRAAGAEVGTVGFTFDRITDEDTIDPSLRLVFPGVAADANGLWVLPIFKSIFRVTDPPAAAPGRGGPDTYGPDATLTFPGRVGDLGDLVLLR
ncbi:hypothetical protein [Phycisphaera mikurensis]|uniref:Uncharacterized protein n=1 Tax=Phycisphaera mikurensis (strain NBRC 102666 / KCTC 22515 / FYK2301M01) TaxID=1142394 RepID=I0IFF9_PHYMF|nr:hypothetical protein [Phycisphaera mikurensis]MBB6440611.1 hypothetical protein [Phycisphaera mikurensis]BAM03997.1 hypothetical protein PSMK_18380 [Phycisphaera mikurensis NBRC 102666]